MNSIEINRLRWITGLFGLVAAGVTGTGEFLLHFDPQARFTDGLAFFQGIGDQRTTMGHFLGVLGAPMYVVGAFHIYLMLKSSHAGLALSLIHI